MPMLIQEAISEAPHNSDPDALALSIVAQLLALPREEAIDALVPLITHQITMVRRNRVRQIERTLPTDLTRLSDPTREIRTILEEQFYCPAQHGYVVFGDATESDLLSYANYMRTKAEGHILTAERYESAAALIRERGVTCLRELEGERALETVVPV